MMDMRGDSSFPYDAKDWADIDRAMEWRRQMKWYMQDRKSKRLAPAPAPPPEVAE